MHFNWQTPESLKSVTTKLQFIKIWKDFRKNLVDQMTKFLLIIALDKQIELFVSPLPGFLLSFDSCCRKSMCTFYFLVSS